MFENGAYNPDNGRLVPKVIVSPFTPVVSLAPFGQADVSINVDDVEPGVVSEPLLGGLAVERLPPQADASSATASRQVATAPTRERWKRRAGRAFMGGTSSL